MEGGPGGFGETTNLWPHWLQKSLSGGWEAPHDGQIRSACTGAPQRLQNLESSGFSIAHFGHRMALPSGRKGRPVFGPTAQPQAIQRKVSSAAPTLAGSGVPQA